MNCLDSKVPRDKSLFFLLLVHFLLFGLAEGQYYNWKKKEKGTALLNWTAHKAIFLILYVWKNSDVK